VRRVWPSLLLTGCITSNVGVGVLTPMAQLHERRDPDPTVDPNGQPVNPWAPEQAQPKPGSRAETALRIGATIAAIAAGAIPAIVWHGTFDENRLFDRHAKDARANKRTDGPQPEPQPSAASDPGKL
jgi:hypothetical protein